MEWLLLRGRGEVSVHQSDIYFGVRVMCWSCNDFLLYDYVMTSPELIERARELRKNPTKAEALLWERLRNGQLGGLKFRRQHPVCGFILDFYCKKARLAIELDGGVHVNTEQKEYDRERTRELEETGVMILRFWNREVTQNIDDVLEKIKKSAEERIKK